MNFNIILKCIFIGNSQVGKTTIINSFFNDDLINNTNSNIIPTIGINYKSKYFELIIKDDIKKINLIVYDNSLSYKLYYFDNVNKIIYSNINVFFIVFNLNDIESFNSIDYWNNIIQQNIIKNNTNTNINKILIGNNFHEKNKISLSKILNKCKKFNLIYIENIDIKNKLNSLFYQILCSINDNEPQENDIKKITKTFNLKNNKYDCIIN